MNNKDVKIEVVFIGKGQWESGLPYLGFDNNKTIDSIRKHLNEKFNKIDFNYS